MTWKQTSTVGEGGRIELVVPDLQPGETVEVQVERKHALPGAAPSDGKREMGFLRGQIWMADDFDAPLEDFAEYM
jgi:hypothetical protein